MDPLHCTLVTPERTVVDQPAEFVALPLWDGEIGISPGRAAMIGRVGCGEMRIEHEDQTSRFYVEGGFVEVVGDAVCVLTPRAIPAGDLDEAAIHEQLHAALAQRATTPEQFAARDRAVAQRRAQLRVARRAK
jgi:F-type H+-transporting ATPase subunit epsilon